ncbi:hypothetical protein I5M27_06095 [Adhaeribacter sp. BT258]|uniref:Uncharacterized protein n=1 Tax=Adhaeribacter terrigena TaxID=2793070 RepID=A0ABS1BZR4_9BACT|nr:hypothetical protein [Adhaeribacter terrigena]MBK0402548.1 hypothetical protein [Adhaeribacter terrigena]
MKEEPKYIGTISNKTLRDYVLDNNLSNEHKILLHPNNFDDIVLEYRDLYKKSIPDPYYIFETLIDESPNGLVPADKILVKKV